MKTRNENLTPQNGLWAKSLIYNVSFSMALLIMIAACSSATKNKEMAYETSGSEAVPATKEAEYYVQLEKKAVPLAVDSAIEAKKWIRKADLKFKVDNVLIATDYIEKVSSKYAAFITLSDLKSSVYRITSIPVGMDSLLEKRHYSVDNQLIIRVPNIYLDSLLKELKPLMQFLDYRKITAEDASIKLLSNWLQSKRLNAFEKRYANDIDAKGKKLNDVLEGEESLLNKQTLHDQQTIESIKMQDEVLFSTICLNIYQNPVIVTQTIADEYKKDKPSLGFRLMDALQSGFDFIATVLVFLVRIWVLIIAVVAGYMLYVRIKKNRKKAMEE